MRSCPRSDDKSPIAFAAASRDTVIREIAAEPKAQLAHASYGPVMVGFAPSRTCQEDQPILAANGARDHLSEKESSLGAPAWKSHPNELGREALIRQRVLATQAFLDLSHFLGELPIHISSAAALDHRAPSQLFVRYHGKRNSQEPVGALSLCQCFHDEPNKLATRNPFCHEKIP